MHGKGGRCGFGSDVFRVHAGSPVLAEKTRLGVVLPMIGKPDVGRSAIENLISQDKVIAAGGDYSKSVAGAAVAVKIQS